jgi:hypothetical protein
MHPFYDPSKKNEQELQDDMAKMMEQRSHAYGLGLHNWVNDLDMIIDSIHEERQNRKFFESIEGQETSGVIDIGSIEILETPDGGKKYDK